MAMPISSPQVEPLFRLTTTGMSNWLRIGLRHYHEQIQAGERDQLYAGFKPYSILFAGRDSPFAGLLDIYESVSNDLDRQNKLLDALILTIESLRWDGPDSHVSKETLLIAPDIIAMVRSLKLVPVLDILSKRVCPPNGWRLSQILYDSALNAAIHMASSGNGRYMLRRLVFEGEAQYAKASAPAIFAALLKTVDASDMAQVSALAMEFLPSMPTLKDETKDKLYEAIVSAVGSEHARSVFASPDLAAVYVPDLMRQDSAEMLDKENRSNVTYLQNSTSAK